MTKTTPWERLLSKTRSKQIGRTQTTHQPRSVEEESRVDSGLVYCYCCCPQEEVAARGDRAPYKVLNDIKGTAAAMFRSIAPAAASPSSISTAAATPKKYVRRGCSARE